tara:strand:+ start:692 stop:805 length:114 start_codon:yes stop_codon:yes gene_type:complete
MPICDLKLESVLRTDENCSEIASLLFDVFVEEAEVDF